MRWHRLELLILEDRILLTTPTSIALSSASSSTVYGQTATFTAVVTPADSGTPTGTVHFEEGGVDLGTGTLAVSGGNDQATFTVGSLPVGSNSIIAVYDGDGSYDGSTSDAYTQTVNQAYVSVLPGVSATMLAPGQPVTLTALVTAVSPGSGTPGGVVTFSDGSTTLGTATLSGGSVSLNLSTGLPTAASGFNIQVSYGGDSNFYPLDMDSGSEMFGGTDLPTETLFVNPPANDPVQATVNCGCLNSEGSASQVMGRMRLPRQPGVSDSSGAGTK